MSTNDKSLTAVFAAAQKRERELTISREEFTETTDTIGGGTVEYAAGMQFLVKVGDGSRYCANLCLHYDAPGYINDIELPDSISVEELDAYSLAFKDAAEWYRQYKKTREDVQEDEHQRLGSTPQSDPFLGVGIKTPGGMRQ